MDVQPWPQIQEAQEKNGASAKENGKGMGIDVYRDLLLEANYCLLVAVVMEIEGEDVSEERGIAELELLINQSLLWTN